MRAAALLIAAAALLAACDPPAGRTAGGEGAGGFSHTATGDLSGYYVPVEPARIEGHALERLFIGQAADLDRWAQGGTTGAAPLALEFAGPDGRPVRIAARRFAVDDRSVRFAGEGGDLGTVSFDGRLDRGALATARRNLGEEAPVLSGVLRAGGRSAPVRLRWYGGD